LSPVLLCSVPFDCSFAGSGFFKWAWSCSEILSGALGNSGTCLIASKWRPAGIRFRLCGPNSGSLEALYDCFNGSLRLEAVDLGDSSDFDMLEMQSKLDVLERLK